MASYKESVIETFKAAGAIPANRLVKLTAVDTVALCTVAGEKAIGVSYGSAAAANDLIEVVTAGGAKLKLAEITGIMKFLSPTVATGEGSLANAGEFAVAQAMESGIVGDIISVAVAPINIIANE